MPEVPEPLARRFSLSLPLWAWAAVALLLLSVFGGLWVSYRSIQRKQSEQSEATRGIWTDPATGLVWTQSINSQPMDWNLAVSYCTGLTTGDSKQWRLPEREELMTLLEGSFSDMLKARIAGGSQKQHLKKSVGGGAEPDGLWTARVTGANGSAGTGFAAVFSPYSGLWRYAPFNQKSSTLCVHGEKK